MSILFKGNLEEGNYTLIKTIDGWVLKGETSYVGFNFGDRPQAEWIPCSERLPEKDGSYLVCMRWNYYNIDVLMWVDGWNCIRRIDGEIDRESEIDGADILAWMPLPEPYRDEYKLATEQMEHDALYESTYNPEDGSM